VAQALVEAVGTHRTTIATLWTGVKFRLRIASSNQVGRDPPRSKGCYRHPSFKGRRVPDEVSDVYLLPDMTGRERLYRHILLRPPKRTFPHQRKANSSRAPESPTSKTQRAPTPPVRPPALHLRGGGYILKHGRHQRLAACPSRGSVDA
jgi:hypothetical protein